VFVALFGLHSIVLQLAQALGNRTPVTYDHGDMTKMVDNFKPDTAYFDPNIQPPESRPNRAPGDMKPSWKWTSALRNDPLRNRRDQFKQALSQINWYMKQHHTQYGYILTDTELVAVRRLGRNGNIELSAPIAWTTHGDAVHPQLTVLLALWYLGMLASEDQGPHCWYGN
jgi:hypothetical protein